MNNKTTYKDAGVDISKAEDSVDRIKKHVKSTLNDSVMASIGSFGAMYDLKQIVTEYKEPVLVQSIDSVGTKLIIANMSNKHSTIGIDMVAHSCNDILCQGAKPITFLDYIAVDKLDPKHIEEIVTGMSEACREVNLPIVGGEIAELPGVYMEGEYDLVGSVTGIVDKGKIINGSRISSGDIIIGLESSGLHTNGYSLARKVLFDVMGFDVSKELSKTGNTLGDELLTPHKNYTPSVLPLLDKADIKGIAHITGGGFSGNVKRILPSGCKAVIDKDSWDLPYIFKLIMESGNISSEEMHVTFNCGIGLILVINESEKELVLSHMKDLNVKAFTIGKIKDKKGEEESVVI